MKRYLIPVVLLCVPVIYWTCSTVQVKKDRIRFSHATHAGAEVECSACHKRKKLGMAIPNMSDCMTCHEEQQDNCKMCHSNPQVAEPAKSLRKRFNFSHEKHMKRVKNGCLTCHKGITKDLKRRPFLGHQGVACMKCHVHRTDFAKAMCTKCHRDMADLPPKRVGEYVHRDVMRTGRHTVAVNNERTCVQCHDRNFCLDCHSKNTRLKAEIKIPSQVGLHLIHRGNYLLRHQFDARRNPQSCTKCHGRSSCVKCHEKQGVNPITGKVVNPHPPGWDHSHGAAARMNILKCASCHDKGARSICVRCHSTGGINPHPASWTWRNKGTQKLNNKMCKICHTSAL